MIRALTSRTEREISLTRNTLSLNGFTVQSTLPRVYGYPIEDSYQIDLEKDIVVVADGVTRDVSRHLPDKNTLFGELYFLFNYQRPSHAANVTNLFTSAFVETLKNSDSIDERAIRYAYNEANRIVRNYNRTKKLGSDFLLNDLAGCVSSAAVLSEGGVYLSHICDSGAAIIDKDGKVKAKTTNDGAIETLRRANDPEYLKRPDERDPSTREWLRANFRNNPNARFSHGVINGDQRALEFVNVSYHELEKGDTVLVYSDGIEEIMFYRAGVLRPEFQQPLVDRDFERLRRISRGKVRFEGTLCSLLV